MMNAQKAGVSCFLISTINIVLLLILRQDLQTDYQSVFAVFSLAGGIFLSPFLLSNRQLTSPLAVISCYALAFITPLLGLIGLGMLVIPLSVLVIINALCISIRQKIFTTSFDMSFIITIVIASLYIFGTSHVQGYGTVYLQEAAKLGILPRDTYFHITLANMMYAFKNASMGIGNLEPLHYHIGFHTWLASFSEITGANLTETLTFIKHGIALPATIMAIMLSVVLTVPSKVSPHKLLISIIFILMATDYFMLKAPAYWMSSESHNQGIMFLFLALACVGSFIPLFKKNIQPSLAGVLLFSILMLLATVSKVSVGIVLLGFVGYLCLRFHGFKWPTFLLGIVLVITLWLVKTYMVILRVTHIEFFNYLITFGVVENLFSIVPLVIFIFCSAYYIKRKPVKDIPPIVSFKMFEALFVTALFCIITPNIIFLMAGAGGYITDVIRWIGIWVLCVFVMYYSTLEINEGAFVKKLWKLSGVTLALGSFVILLYALVRMNLIYGHLENAAKWGITENNTVQIAESKDEIVYNLTKGYASKLDNALNKVEIPSETAVYIPMDSPYWNWPKECAYNQYYYFQVYYSLPILTVYPNSGKCEDAMLGKGSSVLPESNIYRRNLMNEDADSLCRHVSEQGFSSVIILFHSENNPYFERIDC